MGHRGAAGGAGSGGRRGAHAGRANARLRQARLRERGVHLHGALNAPAGRGGAPAHLRADASGIARAAALLRTGALVAFGTETVYGLGAIATDGEAVARVFAAKGRPRFNPLICHVADAAAAWAIVVASPDARRLAARFWPGPLTLVLPRRDAAVSSLASAGSSTLAIRVPAGDGARALLRAVGAPVVAPSANRSGRISPTIAAHVLAAFDADAVAAVLDTGPCPVGVESTVVDLSGARPVLLRPGGLARDALGAALGRPFDEEAPGSDAPRSPGLGRSHYAPALPLRLDARTVAPDEALLAFGVDAPRDAALRFELSARGDLAEAAARLFAGLHHLDAEGARRGLVRIAASPVPAGGLGDAIRDRLARAAAPRPA